MAVVMARLKKMRKVITDGYHSKESGVQQLLSVTVVRSSWKGVVESIRGGGVNMVVSARWWCRRSQKENKRNKKNNKVKMKQT
jgi:hypothetical protein